MILKKPLAHNFPSWLGRCGSVLSPHPLLFKQSQKWQSGCLYPNRALGTQGTPRAINPGQQPGATWAHTNQGTVGMQIWYKSLISAQNQWAACWALCMPASPCRDASHDCSSRLSESLAQQIVSERAGNKHAEMLKQQLSDETTDCTYINNPSDINHGSHLGLRWIQLQPHSSLNLETQWKGFPGSFVWACPLCITHWSVLCHLTLLHCSTFTMEFC